MLLDAVPLALAGTSFALGARHGLDWDHIAALTDLTAPRPDDAGRPHRHARRGTGLALRTASGTAWCCSCSACSCWPSGWACRPGWTPSSATPSGSRWSSSAAWCSTSSAATGAQYRYAGRISLVVGALRRGWARARRREAPSTSGDVDRRGAFLVGLLHGTGAETPTQVALFATAGASGSTGTAALVLAAFVAGLVLADLGIAAAWLSGLLGSGRTPRVQVALGGLTGLASLTLGGLILTGYSDLVPPLAGS